MAEELLSRPPAEDGLSRVIDVLVSGRPEEPLLRLSRALETGPLDEVEGLVRRGPGQPPKIVADGVLTPEELPAPSFNGLPLNRYFSPEPVLPVRASSRAAEQIIALGTQHDCRRFLLTGGLDPRTAEDVARRLAAETKTHAWFASLDREGLPDEELSRRLSAGGCVKLQIRVGPEPPDNNKDLLDQARRAIRFGPPAEIGIHLHCRLEKDTGGEALTRQLSDLFTESRQWLRGPGFSFSCRVLRDGRRGPATGGSPPDLYNDATAPVPGAAPGFGRDPGDESLPPETPGEEQRWRLVREAGAAMGPSLTPGTAVHDFLYLARFEGHPPAPPAAETGRAPTLEPGLVLLPSPGLTRGRFQAYDPAVPMSNGNASGSIRFVTAGLRWRAAPGDGYRCRPLPELAVRILEQCDGERSWEEAAETARAGHPVDGIPVLPNDTLAKRLVRMMFEEGLLVEA